MENGKTAQYDIIETFCKTYRTGLKLLPSPTGSGKSYAAFCYMADSVITKWCWDSSLTSTQYLPRISVTEKKRDHCRVLQPLSDS